MSSVTIRRPKPDEAEALAEIHLKTWEETFSGVFPPSAWGEDARAQRIRQWTLLCTTSDPAWRPAVAELEGEVVGIAFAGLPDDDPSARATHLFAIYLLRGAQGYGVGQALLDEVLGEEPASLWHLENNPNPRAMAFYARNGFAPDGARQDSGFPGAGDSIRLVR